VRACLSIEVRILETELIDVNEYFIYFHFSVV
jgi:hypothetical protein